MWCNFTIVCIILLVTTLSAKSQDNDITISNGVTSYNPRVLSARNNSTRINFKKYISVRLPTAGKHIDEMAVKELAHAISVSPEQRLIPAISTPRVKIGNNGNGQVNKKSLGVPENISHDNDASSANYGLAMLPFTSSRVDSSDFNINESFPYRATGKLFFIRDGQTNVCSASLVDKGVVLTAAHCVAEFGQKTLFSNFIFVPGYRNGDAPFGEWRAKRVYLLNSYLDGTDFCHEDSPGVVCKNDVAVIVVEAKSDNGKSFYAGQLVGWYSVGWNFAGFTPQGTAQLTQLGYPGCLDSGAIMQRNDALGVVSLQFADNLIFGSMMCKGSSGGPILVNFGTEPNYTGTTSGLFKNRNVIVGVTSWGSTKSQVKKMGSSALTNNNIEKIIKQACLDFPDTCS